MTASTAIERVEDGVGSLPQHLRDQINYRKQINTVTSELAKLSWGQNLDRTTVRAVADWGQRYGVDPATEIDVLGNRLYVNAKYYLRKLAEMVAAGRVEYAAPDYIHADTRLDALAAKGDKWASEERERRSRERILHDVDDSAVSACVFRVKVAGVQEFTGCKAVYADSKDPVGNAFPMESTASRAARRCMRHLVSHMPEIVDDIVTVETSATGVSRAIESDRAHQKRLEDSLPPRVPRYGGVLASDEPTAVGVAREDGRAEPVVRVIGEPDDDRGDAFEGDDV